MTIVENISIRPYNSFKIDARARYFSLFESADELKDLLAAYPKMPTLILGGGSNVLFTRNYDGLVCKNAIAGITELHEDPEYVYVKAGAGESWHSLVMHCIDRGWAGLENLSLIPGNVGASPMQNIGAYGVELADVFWDLEALHLHEKTIRTFTPGDCAFGYRDSIFKNKYKGQYAILSVTFRLRKNPIFHTSYGAIQQELDRMGVKELTIKDISRAVIRIRQSKLPDPAIIGNAGSFFKNPSIGKQVFENLQARFPDIVSYPLADGSVKLAAGWLIEQCGWKGYREADAGCHERQALVLVNYGNASGKQVFDLSEKILQSVYKKFGILLEREVNVI